MENLFERSYIATKKRGLITDKTTDKDFWDKLHEEVDEVDFERRSRNKEKLANELADVILVCSAWLKNMGFDPKTETEKMVIKNEKRAKIKHRAV